MVSPVNASTLLDRSRCDGVLTPDYGGFCFGNVPGTAANVLDVAVGRTLPAEALAGVDTDVSHVVVVLLDGLGWHRFHRDRDDSRFLSRLAERGTVTPLTSVCPASTPTAITSVHTGVPPAKHGVVGWDTYLPEAETIVEPFLHGVNEKGADSDRSIATSDVIRADPIYPHLEDAGVDTAVVQPIATLDTPYANTILRGATQVSYDDISAGIRTVRGRLAVAGGQTYTYLYVPHLDATSHEHGTDSAAYHDALDDLTTQLSRALFDRLDPTTAAETLLIVTADHGMIDSGAGPKGDLALHEEYSVDESLARDSSGTTILPFGDPRLLHLRLENGMTERLADPLATAGIQAFTREEVTELGLFGPDPDPWFIERCGDLICTHSERKLLHSGNEHVRSKIGMHGGLSAREMIVPFAVARLSRLQ